MTALHQLNDLEYINKLYESDEVYIKGTQDNRAMLDDDDFSFLYRYGS